MSQVVAMANQIENLERALHAAGDGQFKACTPPAQVQPHQQPTETPSIALPAYNADAQAEHQHSAPAFNSTSAVQEPARDGDGPTATPFPMAFYDTDPVPMSSDQLALWQSKASEVCAMQLRLPIAQISHLFETYWAWVYPAFMFVSRPHFLRSTAAGDRYSSPLLCSVILLQATRFTDHLLREELLSHVRLLLGQEIHRSPSVPLVQALLQLSAREIGNGALHQAWLYSGMAFRLAVDMGIMVKPGSSQTDSTDNAVRGQLAWSCYLWDKAISLYLGRRPSLPECPSFQPVLLDQHIESASWVPYLDDSNTSNIWLPTQSHGVTCYTNFCKIGEIVHDILETIYAKKPGCDVSSFVQHTRERLGAWRTDSPQDLVVLPCSQTCPAPHILSQK